MTEAICVLLGLTIALVIALAWRRFAGFAAQRPEDYAGSVPQIDLRRHLSGAIRCEGVIYGPLGRVVSRFTGDFHTRWDGNHGIMRERFLYESGKTQDREWRLELGNHGAILAGADDIVGMGTGRQVGATVQLKYRIRLDKDAGGHVLDTTDWMYLTPSGTIVNRSQFRKYGIKVAELVATMRQVDT